MKNLIHEITTSLKFIYPCISGLESESETTLIIETETYLTKIYPVKKFVEGMIFLGEDYWGRSSFKDEKDHYYCEVDTSLYYVGRDVDGDPMYPVDKKIIDQTPEVKEDLSEFQIHLDKAKKYFNNHDQVELIDLKTSITNDSNIKNKKIICFYTLKIK